MKYQTVILASVVAVAAFCATAQNYPFPQHVTYAAGIKPSNVSQSSMDSTVSSYWSAYSSRYIKSASTGGYYIAYNIEGQGDPGAATVSEAHGYGMVLCAYMGDKTHFDGMYTYYKNHPSDNNSYLMAWEQSTNGFVDINGADSATDGDMDIAYALLIADKQWGSGGTINYLQAATNMINTLMQSDVNQSAWTLRLGDWATSGTSQGYANATATRPSDFMFDHMRSYYEVTGDGRWTNVINQTYAVVNTLFNNNSPNTGLIPDFVVLNGSTYQPAPANFLEGPTDGEYNYNSCRTPWRFATEYLVRGTTGILTEMRKMNSWIQSSSGGDPNKVYPGYTLAGGALDTSYTDDSFTSPFALCAMIDSGNQSWLNTLWSWVAARGINVGDGYFGNSITMQSVIVISGNWWRPIYSAPADFTISASPSSQSATVGNGTSYTATIAAVNGFSGNVALTASGLPSGATATFSPTSLTGSGSSTLSVTTSASTPGGTYTLTLTGTSGSLVHSATVSLVLADFSIATTPAATTLTADGVTNIAVSIGSINAFNGTVNLTSSGLPSGATGTFAPASTSPPGSSTYTVATATNTAPGSYTVAVTGTSGAISHSANLTLVINTSAGSFSLSATPASQTVTEGGSASYSITVTPSGGFTGTVNLGVNGLGVGTTAGFSPVSITGGSGSSTLTITTTSATPGANGYTLTVTGTSGSLTNTVGLNLTVNPPSPGGPLPGGWTDTDIGGPLYLAGSAGYTNGLFTLNGSGADIWGVGDEYNYAYQSINGDQTVIAQVTGLQDSDPWAKAGLMFRETTSSNATYVGLYVTISNGVSMQYRNGTGTGAVDLAHQAGLTAPYWVKLVRSGNTFTGYSSPDGVTWTQAGATNVTMATSATAGLAVCSHNFYEINTATFTNAALIVDSGVTWTEVNDTSANITYSSGWTYGPSRNLGDYQNDVHYTTGAGNYAQFTFTGTGIQYITETYTDEGNVDVYIDGTFQQTVNCNSSTRQAQVAVYSNTGLSAGSHTIKVVKNSGTYMLVDAFAYVAAAPVPDFTISATPGAQTVTAGGNTTYTATISALNGFAGNTALTVSGLPTGVTASFNPTSVSSSGSSTLTVTTTNIMGASTNTLTITGTSGSLVHTATVTLIINPAAWTLVNDTDPGIMYGSTGWSYSTNRNDGDYNNDVHYTKTAANYAQYTFTGTSAEYITEMNTDEGNVDVYIDGTFQATVNCNATSRQAQVVMYSTSGLAYGSHTIKVVKNSGTYMLVDAFGYR